MKPIEFIHFDGDCKPSMPVLDVYTAMEKDIEIFAIDGEYEILSYYYSDGRMILDIQKSNE